MPIVSTKELARTFEQEIGRPAILKRRWVCVLDDNTLDGSPVTETEIITATTGTLWGTAHPGLPAFKFRKTTINEGFDGSPYHVEVIAEYGIVRDEELIAPVDRPAVWSVEGGSAEVPALYYYDGSGNGTTYPLTNSAYDYFPGLMTEEAVARITIKKNFANFPTAWMASMNFVNSDFYFGMPQYTAKVANVSTSYAYEEWGGTVVKYWDTTATITYRQSGHILQLPDIGWNFIGGGQKRRAMVFDFQNSEWVASPNPVGLDGSGGLTLGRPAILARRVNPETAFASLFGTPPT